MLDRARGFFRALLFILCALVATSIQGAESPAPPAAAWLQVGSAAVELEADDSMVIGGGIGPAFAKGGEGKLRAVATAIEGPGRARIVLVALDCLMIRRDYLDDAARAIEKELEVPFDNILINATHTHHAPTTVSIHGYERDEKFCARVRDGAIAAARAAVQRRQISAGGRCELLFNRGEESSVGQNSRILLEDNTIYWVGPHADEVRPTGPFDPELPVLAFRREGGGLEAVLFNHSTHLIGAYEPGKRSPGFYCLAAQELEGELASTVAFFAGAFGSTHNLRLNAREMSLRIKTSIRDSLKAATPRPAGPVRSLKREVSYRVREFDEAKEDEAVSSYCKRRMTVDPTFTIEVFRKMRRELAPHRGEVRKTWVQALRIGDIAWVGVPGELFTKLGMDIKRRSPFRYTYIAGVANDYIGYIPDAAGQDLGGYQTWTGHHSLAAKGTGEMLVDTAVSLLEEIFKSAP